jgi:hypothetical protein
MTIDATAKGMKVTTILDATPFVGLVVPPGQPRAKIRIAIGDAVFTAEVAAKSLRRAVAIIGEHGPDGVALLLQGRLEGAEIMECGIVANVRAAKQVAA